MTVDPDQTNAEAFAAVGLFPPVGLEVTLLFTTIDRKKIIESVHALFGDDPDQTEIAVDAGLYLLEHVPDFHNNETRSGIYVNATLAFQKANKTTRSTRPTMRSTTLSSTRSRSTAPSSRPAAASRTTAARTSCSTRRRRR